MYPSACEFVSDLRQVGGFLHELPRYNWNIVESGVKHHNPTQLYLRNFF